MKKLYLIPLLVSLVGWNSMAQDAQFSQFYAAPMYQNPAFAGSAYAPRLIANYRNQWPSINANFVTSAFSVDHYIEKYNSGVGLLVVSDSQGPGRLKSTEFSGLYSYQLQLGEENFLRLGAQATYSNKSLDYLGLTFGDQYTNRGFSGNPSNDRLADPNNLQPIKFTDFSGGALFYNSKAWVSVALHHINRPTYTFSRTNASGAVPGCPTGDCLPRKLSVSGGWKFPLNNPYSGAANADKEFSVSPAFLYKRQGKFDQLDVGFYGTYASLTAGLWYRGIPIKKRNITRTNHDAAVFLLGYRQDSFSIGYSYDITISSLGLATGGSHELSIAYQLEPLERGNSRKRRNKKELSCPKF